MPNETYSSLNIQALADIKGHNLTPLQNSTATKLAVHVAILDDIGQGVLLWLLNEYNTNTESGLQAVDASYFDTNPDWI